ncbi:virulence RhuM family protein [Treponema sp.]
MSDLISATGDIVLYETPDGKTRIECHVVGETIWLSQALMGELFDRSKQTISEHLQNLFAEGELNESSVVRNFRTTATDGKVYEVAHYNLEAVLAVGFRVKSPRGTQFRKWANTQLREFLVKGFAMDDERLKNPGKLDYFDELLARIREIRASGKRFYQKVRDLFTLSADYKDDEKTAQLFYVEVQNKLLFAVTGKTAAELVVARAKSDEPNMALTSWSGSRVRKQDVIVAKNYLNADEIDSLNRLVVIFLEQAELRVKERKQLSLDFWRTNVDRLLEFNDKQVLKGPGSISHETMKGIAHERYEDFDTDRRQMEITESDNEDLAQLEKLEKQLETKEVKNEK